MVSEVRFRDILAHKSNSDLLRKKIQEITRKNIKWNLISKELPLPFDVVGLQLRHCDIVGFDEENNIYIIELKKKIHNKNIKSTIKQVNDYAKLFEDIIYYIKSNKPLFYYHIVLLRHFEYVNLDYNKINQIIPIMISIEEFDDDFNIPPNINCSFIDDKTLNLLLNNFISQKTKHFINTYNKKLNRETTSILNYAIKKENIDNKSWFPLVISKINLNKHNDSSLNYKYQLVFENVHDNKKIYANITKEYESLLDTRYKQEKTDFNRFILEKFNTIHLNLPQKFLNNLNEFSNIPEIYYRLEYLETFEKIENFFQEAKSQGKTLEFIIQLFRSGRTNPIIYLQLFEDVYLPLIQIKPVVVSIDPTVNRIIAYDSKNNIKEDKTCFYEEVILLDTGTYEISLEKDYGVNFYNITLHGKRNNYDFRVYSPKLRGVKELLPYMTPEKVQDVLDGIKQSKGINYLFKSDEEGDNEWIISKLNVKHQGNNEMKTLCVIPCGNKKIWDQKPEIGPQKAFDVYVGPFHRKCKEYAMKFYPDDWCILSAKYGFLFPDDIVSGPYNVSFNLKRSKPISKEELSVQIRKIGVTDYERIVVLGGKNYTRIIEDIFRDKKVLKPLEGCKGIGYMMQRLNELIEERTANKDYHEDK